MNLGSLWDSLRRRWWVVVPVLLITAGAVIWITSEANAEYEATAILLLADPQIAGIDPETVPEEDDGAILDLSVLIQIVEGDDTRSKLGSSAGTVDYTVTEVGDGVLRIEATSQAEGSVISAANTVMEEIGRVVQDLDDADGSRTAELRVLSQASIPRQRTIVSEGGEEVTEYFASGSVQLVIDEHGSSLQSPFTASAGTLRVIEEAASAATVTESIREEAGDPEATFELIYELRDAAPIVHVVATGSTPDTTLDTMDAVLAFLDGDLAERQAAAGAEESSWIEFQRIALPENAEAPEGRLRRPIATIIALGLVAAAGLAVLVDTLMTPGRHHLRPTMEDGGNGAATADDTRRSRAS